MSSIKPTIFFEWSDPDPHETVVKEKTMDLFLGGSEDETLIKELGYNMTQLAMYIRMLKMNYDDFYVVLNSTFNDTNIPNRKFEFVKLQTVVLHLSLEGYEETDLEKFYQMIETNYDALENEM